LNGHDFASCEKILIASKFWDGRDFSRATKPLKCIRALVLGMGFLSARSSLAAIALALLLSALALAQSAPDIYKAHCSACHGAHGKGDTMLGENLKIRPLASDEVQKQSDAELFIIIGKGKNRMPSFERKLSKDQIGNLVKYIRSLKK
jgi:mono/diheme cytochrome c family protein